MERSVGWTVVGIAVILAVAVGIGFYVGVFGSGAQDGATVTIVGENGTELGTVSAQVADTTQERYTGLSNTDSLGPDEGMLFVHDREGEKAYVMRDMAFPIDMVFIGADRRITTIHHAPVEERPLTRYRGRAKWVLEVPFNWTIDHGVAVGDRVRIDYD